MMNRRLEMLLLVGLLVLLMGCSEGERSLAPEENKVLYPGAPIVSIKKTKLEDGRLFFRIEAQELVPYDIEVRVEGTRDGDRRINESIEMRAGRSVVGTDISLGQNDTTVTLWIELWHGSGDAPYNVGSPSRLTVAYDAPVQVVRTTSDVMNDQLLEVYFNKPPQGLSVEGASEHTVLDKKVVITGRSCRGNIILMWAGGRENLFYDNCPPPSGADGGEVLQTSGAGGGEVLQGVVDYLAEETAIIEAFTLHGEAIGTKDPDEFMRYWLRIESEDVFVAWDFWAGAFEKHLGWKGIKKAWEGIFRLREGKMTVEIESVAINKTGRKASLRGSYKWAINGKLVALMVKDRQEGWKIQQVDYTNKKFGDQVDELENPAYVNPPSEDD